MNIHKQNKHNQSRQFELDITRGLAVIFMVIVHVFIVFQNEGASETLTSEVVDFFGGIPAAPVFMFLLGTGIVYSRKSDPKTLIKRGMILLLSGYILNILRGVIPELILMFQQQSMSELTDQWNIYYNFFNVDILQFAGITFLFFAFLKAMKTPISVLIGVGIGFVGLNHFLPHIDTFNPIFAPFQSLMIGGGALEGLSYFPFITWIIYPIAGYIFAYYLIQTVNKKRFYALMMSGTGLILMTYLIGIFFFQWPSGYETESGYYIHNGILNLIYTSFVLFWISLWYWMSPMIRGGMKKGLETLSSNVSNIYFIHWVMIGFLTILIERETQNVLMLWVISIFMLITSWIIALLYKKRLKARQTTS